MEIQRTKKDDTLSLFFKMESAKSTEDLSNGSITEIFIQFKLKSWDVVKNKWVTRVTTIRKPTTFILRENKHRKEESSKHDFKRTQIYTWF